VRATRWSPSRTEFAVERPGMCGACLPHWCPARLRSFGAARIKSSVQLGNGLLEVRRRTPACLMRRAPSIGADGLTFPGPGVDLDLPAAEA
jgi:hypothetical protein